MVFLNVTNVNVDQSWSVSRIIQEKCPVGWVQVFANAKDELDEVEEILEDLGSYYPLKKNLFRAFEVTPLDKVRVVLVGQDPYHDTIFTGEPRAMGMSFSVHPDGGVTPSLRNIYAELRRSYPEFVTPTHGDLTKWAEQGVLLLNQCLTVQPGVAGSHGKIWLGFIYHVISAICKQNPECIFLLWGKPAQKIRDMIKGSAVVLTCGHPSGRNKSNNFKGCGHFIMVNELLAKRGEPAIDWQV